VDPTDALEIQSCKPTGEKFHYGPRSIDLRKGKSRNLRTTNTKAWRGSRMGLKV